MRASHHGFSMPELLVTLAISMVVSVGIYRIVTHSNTRGVRTIQKTKAGIEANKAMDRLSAEIENAISFTDAKFTLFGSEADPKTGPCRPNMMTYAPHSSVDFPFIAHGLVPLPGIEKNNIDLGDNLLIVNPAMNWSGRDKNIWDNNNDGLRIAYIPVESNPIHVTKHIVDHTGSNNLNRIELNSAELLKENIQLGDYAVIFDHIRREMIRVTHVGVDYVENDPFNCFWNIAFIDESTGSPVNTPFQMTTNVFFQKIQIATYGFDSASHTLYRDNHLLDCGFNPNTKSFDTGKYNKRIPNWDVSTRNLESFKLWFDEKDETERIRTPRAARPINKGPSVCGNQLGYSNFKNIYIDATLSIADVDSSDPSHSMKSITGLVRRLSNPNLQNQPGSLSADPPPPGYVYTAVPVALVPTATPTAIGGGPPPPDDVPPGAR